LDDTITALAAATERFLRALRDPMLDPFLALWPAPAATPRATVPRALPVLRWLGDAASACPPAAREVVTLLAALSPRLAWSQTYTAADFGQDFLDRYGWVELIGTRGPLPSERLAAGFLLLGPGTDYPSHRHEAEEIYVPLSGVAAWWRGDAEWRDRAPGSVIHHAHWMPHAMRTAVAPLLALYLWRGGDLAQKSRID
jgi:mannose-6-phosphate isomerase-like protein (cupin superfamily)